MNLSCPRSVLVGVAMLAVASLTAAGVSVAAEQPPPVTGSVVSGCDNPVLNRNLDGWGRISGSTPFRYPLTDHASATAAYVQANNPGADPRAYLPQMPVSGGEKWTFAVDARTDVPGNGRIVVDWYSTPDGDNSGYLGQSAGPAVPLPAATPATWYRVAGDFTAPPAAVRANVLAGADLPGGADLSLTACDYRPTGTDEPTDPPPSTEEPPSSTEEPPASTEEPPPSTEEPPPSTEEPPPADENTAAARFGWGTPLAQWSDEFNYQGPVDPAKWTLPSGNDGCFAGHAGNGRRCAKNATVDGSKLVMTGDADGDTGWMTSDYRHQYGRIEARVRSFNTGPSGNPYHPLLITWADTVPYPSGGEYDFLENGAPGEACAEAFLHLPGHDPYRQEHAVEADCGAPLSEWTNVAFEWDAESLTGWIDGEQWFDFGAHDITEMPEGSLKVQLDNFFGSGMRPAQYEADWIRFYPAP